MRLKNAFIKLLCGPEIFSFLLSTKCGIILKERQTLVRKRGWGFFGTYGWCTANRKYFDTQIINKPLTKNRINLVDNAENFLQNIITK